MVSVLGHQVGQIEQSLARAAIADPQALVAAEQVVLGKSRAQQRHAVSVGAELLEFDPK